ncbi:RluA family pseudouridine synthase [Sediminibacillus dalangtanensis]|uniref:Pseudouridine synthase n=1 Tax=Sediminibacillus dalangtanensis TaxID=2729421 RepID=A0ABX7VUR5_9BACI|nr:RluA family pseudouridine synthase [Sediminibacillus dalangtanensis]QTM99350.1 RluA family pseudouridine synthase [Sediminibacillus dalangtanensis]
MTSSSHTVQANQTGLRIDKLLAEVNEDASRSQVQEWIKEGLVYVDGSQVKSNHKCLEGEQISWEVPEPEAMEIKAEDIPLSIVYEDSSLLVVNKPKGMVVHPSAGHRNGTMVNALLYHCNDLSGINGVIRPGIVHRIDKDTTGLLVVAKNDQAHLSLAEQLKDKTMSRKYQAIVHGDIQHEYGTIDAPLGRDPKDRQKQAVVRDGRSAVTHFQVIDRFGSYTHVECVLETGRTHQIRVHMKYIGHPLAGDPKYGPKKTLDIEGQALHAGLLGFSHPQTGEWMEFEAPLPDELQTILAKLRK